MKILFIVTIIAILSHHTKGKEVVLASRVIQIEDYQMMN
jgi:hypothetical protein